MWQAAGTRVPGPPGHPLLLQSVDVPRGPGFCYPGLLYLFSLYSVVYSFAVKNFNLFYPCSSLPCLA